jgi:hypothetical protein
MAEAIYLLCILTSLAAAVLLLRGYLRSGLRLLLWSGICFLCLSLNNALLFYDRVLLGPDVSLALWRQLSALFGVVFLIYGLVWDSD